MRCQHDDDVSFVPLCGVRCLQKVGSLRQEVDSPQIVHPLLVTLSPSASPSSSLPPLPHPPAVIPMPITSFPPLLTSCVLSRHSRLASRHSREGGNPTHCVRRAFIRPPARVDGGKGRVVMRNESPVKWTIHTALGCAIIGTRMIRAELDCTRRQCGSPAGQRV